MRFAILYYSITGQTQSVAKAIANGLRENAREVHCLHFKKLPDSILSHADIIGIGSPVHSWGLPLCFDNFWGKIPLLSKKPCFIFITYGHHPGNAPFHLSRKAKAKKLKVFSHFQLTCFDNYPHLHRFKINAGHPDSRDIEKAFIYGKELPGFYNKWKLSGEKEEKFPFSLTMLELSRFMNSRKLNRDVFAVKVYDDKKCNECGACERVCPVGSIKIKPFLHHDKKCTGCTGCVLVCKPGAITVPDGRAFYTFFKLFLRKHYPLDQWERELQKM